MILEIMGYKGFVLGIEDTNGKTNGVIQYGNLGEKLRTIYHPEMKMQFLRDIVDEIISGVQTGHLL